MLLNCGFEEDIWESLGLQRDPVHPKGSQSWISTGRTDAEAETPILWPPDVKSWLIGKDAGKGWRREEKKNETNILLCRKDNGVYRSVEVLFWFGGLSADLEEND